MGLINKNTLRNAFDHICYGEVRGAVSSIRIIGISAIYLDNDDDGGNEQLAGWD